MPCCRPRTASKWTRTSPLSALSVGNNRALGRIPYRSAQCREIYRRRRKIVLTTSSACHGTCTVLQSPVSSNGMEHSRNSRHEVLHEKEEDLRDLKQGRGLATSGSGWSLICLYKNALTLQCGKLFGVFRSSPHSRLNTWKNSSTCSTSRLSPTVIVGMCECPTVTYHCDPIGLSDPGIVAPVGLL